MSLPTASDVITIPIYLQTLDEGSWMGLSAAGGERKWLRNWSEWVGKCSLRHGGKYTYGNHTRERDSHGRWKVEIVCPAHGAFWQAPEKHAFGRGCPRCSGNTLDSDPIQEMIRKFPKLDFSLAVYAGSRVKMMVICPDHGRFEADYNKLQQLAPGSEGCPSCGRVRGGRAKRKVAEDWQAQIDRQHGEGAYRLGVDTLEGGSKKALFTCGRHGEFWALPSDLANGHRCPSCGDERRKEWHQVNTKVPLRDFVLRASEQKAHRYIYDSESYEGMRPAMKMWCLSHGAFWQIPRNHLHLDAGCPRCSNSRSKGEEDVVGFLKGLGVEVRLRDREVLKGRELDILVPEKNVAIEYCGLYWHGEAYKSKGYHREKLDQAQERGVELITVFEDEWLFKRDAVKAVLMSRLGLMPTLYQARKLNIRKARWGEVSEFYEDHHLQGAGRPGYANYVLEDGHRVVAAASFGSARFGDLAEVELLRFTTVGGVVGALGKLMAQFRRDYPSVSSVVSYSDRRWFSGGAYKALGFHEAGNTEPGYQWCKATTRYNRHGFQKHKLAKRLKKFDPDKSEVENCLDNGYWRIFDCGMTRWVYRGGTHEG